jgi:hypothetical protein
VRMQTVILLFYIAGSVCFLVGSVLGLFRGT